MLCLYPFGSIVDRRNPNEALLHIEIGARTDLGRVRKNNEDCYLIDSSLQLFVLSDGMGGEAHGEVRVKPAGA